MPIMKYTCEKPKPMFHLLWNKTDLLGTGMVICGFAVCSGFAVVEECGLTVDTFSGVVVGTTGLFVWISDLAVVGRCGLVSFIDAGSVVDSCGLPVSLFTAVGGCGLTVCGTVVGGFVLAVV